MKTIFPSSNSIASANLGSVTSNLGAVTPNLSTVNPKIAEAEKVAQEFETLFLDMVVKGMRQTAKPEESSNALDIFTGMLDQETTKTMSSSQSFGVKNLILDWMKSADPALVAESINHQTNPGALKHYLKAQKAF